jgi:hypothetical protein
MRLWLRLRYCLYTIRSYTAALAKLPLIGPTLKSWLYVTGHSNQMNQNRLNEIYIFSTESMDFHTPFLHSTLQDAIRLQSSCF